MDAQSVIDTYSSNEQFSCQKYSEYQKLVVENPSLGYKRCAKLLGVPKGRTRWWHTKGVKRAVPLPLKAVKKLEAAGLLPFDSSHQHAPLVLNMLGTLFGDGGIDCRLNNIAFISSDKRDIDLWLADLLEVFPFARGKTQIVEGGEYGHSYNLRCYDRAVIRFFVALGAPVGDKITKVYSLPNWLGSSMENLKLAFLDGYFAAEASVVRYRADSRGKFRFTDFSLGVSKILELEREHLDFLKSVESLLESVGISTTGNVNKNSSAGSLRKDGFVTANYRIFVRTTFWRVLHFNDLFRLRYAGNKKARMEKVIAGAIAHRQSLGKPVPNGGSVAFEPTTL